MAYDIALSDKTYLVNIYGGVTLEIPLLTEIHKNDNLAEIRLQCIVETDPELRVKKLIQKGLIEKAEIFAQTFNVDPQFIAKVKAEHIVDKFEATTEQIEEFLRILEHVDDKLFKMKCYDSVTCKTGFDTRRILCQGAFMDIGVRDSSENDDNELLFLKRNFNKNLHKFDTFMQVYREYDKRKWNYFVNCDLINEVKMFLQQDRAEEASLIYSRMTHYEIESLSDETVEDVFVLLQQTFKSTSSFLKTFIPLTLKFKPDALSIVVDWIHGRIYQFEKEITNFPDCAISFLEDITALISFYMPTRSHLSDECRNILTNLLKALKNIQMLLNNFSINLPLTEYLSDPQDIVHTLLNIDLEPQNLELLMAEFLYPFMLKCGVDTDDLLIEQMKGIFIYNEDYWLNIVHVLLKFICRADKKLEAIREILEIASKPYTDKVKDIARMAFEIPSSSPILQEITESLRDEPIKIILKKYNINRTKFLTDGDKNHYFRRIIYLNRDDDDTAIQDIHQLCINDEDYLKTDLIIIKEYIKYGNVDKAMEFFQKSSDVLRLGSLLMEDIYNMGGMKNFPEKYRKLYHSVLNPLWCRINFCNTERGQTYKDIKYYYELANAIYGIRSDFGIEVNTLSLRTSEREKILEMIFQKIHERVINVDESSFSFEIILHSCKKLASYFNLSLETIFLRFMKCCDHFSAFLNIGKYLLETSTNPETLTLCAVYFFRYTKDNLEDVGDETFLDVVAATNRSNSDDTNDLEAIELARKLCVKALIFAHEDQMYILEILGWIDSCYYLSNIDEKTQFQAKIYQNYLPMSSPYYFGMAFGTIKSIFNVYCAFVATLKIPGSKYLTFFGSNRDVLQVDFQSEFNQFIYQTRVLLKQEQHLIVFNMITVLLRSSLIYPALHDHLNPLRDELINKILPETINVIMSQKYIDKAMLLNLMLYFDKNSFNEHLSKYLGLHKKQPKKLNVITQVGLNLLVHHRINYGKEDLLNILNMCKWWFRIDDPKIKYEWYFSCKAGPRLEVLLTENKLTLENLPEYCEDFALNLQKWYLKYLEITLLNWQPDMEYSMEVSGKKCVNVKNSENQLLGKCSPILKCIEQKSEVFKLTEKIWPLINFYYYEVYLALLSIHMTVASSGPTIPQTYRPLLLFLKDYKRVSTPTRSEIEQWHGTFASKARLEPLSEFRLPLTSTFLSADIWNIIKQEVNLDTYKEWFKVLTFLKDFINQQDICTYAISSPISSKLIDNVANTNDWELKLKYDYLLPKVDECARNISDLERATAAVYALMGGMPNGADKVEMARLSYKYAKLYRKSKIDDPEVEKVYAKVKQRYLNYSVIHILHKYQLAEETYLEQVAQPSDLIWELYNDYRIELFFNNLIADCPDINNAVEEICILFSLNLKRERCNVLLKFLEVPSPLELDCKLLLQGNETLHLKRACYLCKTYELKYWQKWLYELGIKNSSERDMSFKTNALRCFYYVSDIETIEEMFQGNHDLFVIFLNKMSVMAKMCDLGFKFESVVQLDEGNKKRLLKNLAKVNSTTAIKCIASICKIYDYNDLKYWEYIINYAVQFHMLKDLQDYLLFLKGRCVSDCIKKGWHVILSDLFSNLNNNCTQDKIKATNIHECDVFLLLKICPVIYELDMEPYIQKCLLNNRPDVAEVLQQFKKS